MNMTLKRGLPVLALAAVGSLALAQIKSLTLPEMVDAVDDAVYGEIVSSEVSRTVDPEDGEFYFTTIRIEGRRTSDGEEVTVPVTFYGGWLNENEGCWNSEAPSADDVQIGNRIVAFYKWSDDMGGGMQGNGLYALHGGLFRTLEGPSGPTVLGRGPGYAIERNTSLANLDVEIKRLHQAKVERQQREERR